jgi:hypothetical protein
MNLLSKVKSLVWGTYSYSPGFKGDILVTLHLELPKCETVSFQEQGKPENVITKLAHPSIKRPIQNKQLMPAR